MTVYELYHDESMENGYWHGILLVPAEKKALLLEYLEQARRNTGYRDPLGIKKVKRNNRVFDCASSWVQLGLGFMRSRAKTQPFPVSLGKRGKQRVLVNLSQNATHLKFILFRERDNHKTMTGYPDRASKIETTFRFGIKGGLHFLGSDEQPIHIEKMHFDGHKHHLRHLDRNRIVGRLQGLRRYCSISSRPDIIDDRSSDHRAEDAQSYEDCQLLQLTDLLIGSFRTALGVVTRDIHKELARLPKELILDYRKGYARMRNSRWFSSFWLSECFLQSDGWHFQTLEFIESDTDVKQLPLL